MNNLLTKANQWLEHRFWWWLAPLGSLGVLLGLGRFCCESSF